MKSRPLAFACALTLGAIPSMLYASNPSNVTVTSIVTGPNFSVAYFTVSGPALTTLTPPTPPCNKFGAVNRFVLYINTDGGEAALSLLQEAQAAGRTISVNGTGDCSVAGDTEAVNYITVN